VNVSCGRLLSTFRRHAIAKWSAGILLLAAPIISQAMDLARMRSLAGASLLDLRVDALFKQCGLPSVIVDTADDPKERKTLHWNRVDMTLSSKNWEIHYSRKEPAAGSAIGWRNPTTPEATCLANLAILVLDTKGESGILSVKKRDDDQGYITTYKVPDNLYAAHQVVGITATLERSMPSSELAKAYGPPTEIIKREGGISIHRYWVVHRDGKMPLSAYAVDFEVNNMSKTCDRYAAYASGVKFVQDKLDALIHQWEKVYVID